MTKCSVCGKDYDSYAMIRYFGNTVICPYCLRLKFEVANNQTILKDGVERTHEDYTNYFISASIDEIIKGLELRNAMKMYSVNQPLPFSFGEIYMRELFEYIGKRAEEAKKFIERYTTENPIGDRIVMKKRVCEACGIPPNADVIKGDDE